MAKFRSLFPSWQCQLQFAPYQLLVPDALQALLFQALSLLVPSSVQSTSAFQGTPDSAIIWPVLQRRATFLARTLPGQPYSAAFLEFAPVLFCLDVSASRGFAETVTLPSACTRLTLSAVTDSP